MSPPPLLSSPQVVTSGPDGVLHSVRITRGTPFGRPRGGSVDYATGGPLAGGFDAGDDAAGSHKDMHVPERKNSVPMVPVEYFPQGVRPLTGKGTSISAACLYSGETRL